MRTPQLATRRLLLLTLFASVAPMAVANDAIDNQVGKEIADGMFLGAVVLAGTPDEVLFHEAYGERDTGTPMKKDSLFDVASITKVSTIATLLAITMDRRPEVSLDDLMQDYLGGMTGKGADEITIRHTATHRSGLDNSKQLQKESKREALVDAILDRDIRWPVGSRFEYSCLGMIRLSEMIGSINGVEFGKFCEENIFSPLGMTDTRFGPIPPHLRGRCVRFSVPIGEISDSNARRIGRPVGNAGLFTTAGDLSKLATLWLSKGEYRGERLFSEEIWRTFTSEGIVWRVGAGGDNIPARLSPRTFWHTGYTGQTLLVDPEREIYIIVLTNWTHRAVRKANTVSDRARRRIAEVVIAECLVE